MLNKKHLNNSDIISSNSTDPYTLQKYPFEFVQSISLTLTIYQNKLYSKFPKFSFTIDCSATRKSRIKLNVNLQFRISSYKYKTCWKFQISKDLRTYYCFQQLYVDKVIINEIIFSLISIFDYSLTKFLSIQQIYFYLFTLFVSPLVIKILNAFTSINKCVCVVFFQRRFL